MSQNDLVYVAQNALYTTMLAAAPMLGIGVLVGLIVSVFQATTQINDQTLVFVPKILAVLLALLFTGAWIMNLLADYTIKLIGGINTIIG